uniref:Uncharacterized protein n=1 Tax=Rhizophora mucronata TaxID=61149 RepID=A0A2P2QGB7_RHIMU
MVFIVLEWCIHDFAPNCYSTTFWFVEKEILLMNSSAFDLFM